MAKKKSNSKKAVEEPILEKIAGKLGQMTGELIVAKNNFVEMAGGAIDSVKETIQNITAKKPVTKKAVKAVAKKAVKAATKKVVKKTVPIAIGTKKVAKKAIAKAVKKTAPVKKAVKKAIKKVAKKAAPAKKIIKKAAKKVAAATRGLRRR